ncbi:MAG: GAF domain-containing protein [Chloroflexi bacterium]|nr:GAF domain-containing protein [Chloroflexota bacterium]
MISKVTNPQEGINALQDWREEVFLKIIRIIGVAGTFAYVIGIALEYKNLFSNLGFFFAYSLAYVFIMVAAYIPRISTVYRTYIFTFVIALLGVVTSVEKAAIGDGRIWLLLAVFLATVFLGRRAGLVYVLVTTLAWALTGTFFASSALQKPSIDQFSFGIWSGTTVTFVVVGIITVLTVNALSVHLSQNVDRKAALVEISEAQSKKLQEQHLALERRSKMLEAASGIVKKLTGLEKYEDILERVPNLTSEFFSLNSASIFLLETESSLYLASSSEWNEQDKNRGVFSLSINEDIVGMAVTENVSYSNIDSDAGLKTTLAETNSYVAIPLHGRKELLGALVLQSKDEDAFGEERVNILENFVEQVALLLENAKLFTQREKALEAERRAYGQITERAWSEFVSNQEFGAYRRDANGLSVLPEGTALHSDESEIEYEHVPIRIRGKVVGYIDAHKPKDRAWTASERESLRILTTRLETAIDGARLYEEAQENAERDRIISETSTRLRESLDVEGVLKIAASELQKKLGIAEAEVWLDADYLQDKDAASQLENGYEESTEKTE